MSDEISIVINETVSRLNHLLPLKARQSKLAPDLKQLHRKILYELISTGSCQRVNVDEPWRGDFRLDKAFHHLASEDLIVLDRDGRNPVGAYPLTTETTPHHVNSKGVTLNAMCALDAVSVAPMFENKVCITSQCHVSAEPVTIVINGENILSAEPEDIMVGIRWKEPGSVAAHSLCREMVFLKDSSIAKTWARNCGDDVSLLTISDSIIVGRNFFKPLLDEL